jgi:hypothetical protein
MKQSVSRMPYAAKWGNRKERARDTFKVIEHTDQLYVLGQSTFIAQLLLIPNVFLDRSNLNTKFQFRSLIELIHKTSLNLSLPQAEPLCKMFDT